METVKNKKNKILKTLKIILFVLLLSICSIVIFFNVTHEYFVVYGPSMTPTLNQGVFSEDQTVDSVFVSKIKSYTRGDIIVTNRNYGVEGESAKYVIKRIIALAGDKIKIKEQDGYNRIVLIKSGETEEGLVDEPYLLDYSINMNLLTGFENMVNKLALRELIKNLTAREKQIIIMRYYLDKTQSEIAKELGVSQVQISRIENKVLLDLKDKLENI